MAGDNSWKVFKLNETTESDVIFLFGTPDNVDMECTYDEIEAAMQSDGKITVGAYELHYTRLHGDLNILKGPLGEAISADVVIENGKVVEVKWEYDGPYRANALRLWESDETLQAGGARPGLKIAKKNIGDGMSMLVTCYQDDKGRCLNAIRVDILPEVNK
ncbi:MAG: hypothetical protein JRN15_18925 [Nitrososphaerota archaeon]|nr:hypothetical protein [Nitrososphaerota archaeon]